MVTVLRYCHRRKRQLINEGETNQRLASSATLISGSRPNWLSGLLANRDKMHMIDHVKAHLMIGIELLNHIYITPCWVNTDTGRRVNCYCHLAWFPLYSFAYGVTYDQTRFCNSLSIFSNACVLSRDPQNGLFNATVDNALEFSINYLSSCWELKMCNFLINTQDRISLFPLYKSVSSIFICSLKCTKFFTVVNAECMQCQFSIWNSVNNWGRYSL